MGGISKPLIKLGKKTLFEYVLEAFMQSAVSDITVVCSEENKNQLSELASPFTDKPVFFTLGGKTRAESVFNGVKNCGKCGFVIVHDCARPFVTPELINSVIDAAKETGAATACAKVADTVKIVDAERNIIYTPERRHLLAIQTPQCFKYDLYLPAYLLAASQRKEFTDESALLENAGTKVSYCETEEINIKLTTKNDVNVARAIRLLKEQGKI